mmetsp:Transcript_130549/g.279055  ORF Transcript_130549/g.279055 Transcript_130549/m.279055 type:complete len:501 (+) Transcript_130549:64-1566(+)
MLWLCAACLFVTGASLSLVQQKSTSKAKEPIAALQGCFGLDCVERYAFHEDGALAWNLQSKERPLFAGYTKYTVEMTSQSWLADVTVNHDGLWNHTLTVVVPDSLKSNSQQQPWAMFFINEQSWLAEEMAKRTGVVCACLTNVPRSGVDFTFDNRGALDEETMKAFGFVAYAKHSNHPEWPIEMPSTKATVKGMDVVQALLTDYMPSLSPSKFIVGGASKRGVVAYLTALVDPRVKALIPAIITLDIDETAKLRDQALSKGARTVYDDEGVPEALRGEAADRVKSIINPIQYSARLDMPKLLMNCGNDDWFPPDQLGLSWHRLPQPKSYYLYPNSHHIGFVKPNNVGTDGPDFVDTMDAWVNGLVMNKPEPQLTWNVDEITGEISVQLLSSETASSVRLWKAETLNGETRDFRNVHWTSEPLDKASRHWQVTPSPSKGVWQAMFVSFEFPGPKQGGPKWKRSTEVSVMPKLLPFPVYDNISASLGRNISLPGYAVGSPAV